MKALDILLFIVLAALWGLSFLFYRVLTPVLGIFLTAGFRTLVGGLALLIFLAATRFPLDVKRNWRHYLVVGLLNSALPFILFSWAALRVTASVESILNALTPLWGALLGAIFLGERITARKVAGVALGIGGVVIIALFGSGRGSAAIGGELLAVLACVAATMFYGLSGTYLKTRAKGVQPREMAAASLFTAGIVLVPPSMATAPVLATVAPAMWLYALLFAILCSALANLIFFRMVARSSLILSLSITLAIPVFAFGWAFLLLGETAHPAAFGGAALVLLGMALIMGIGTKKS